MKITSQLGKKCKACGEPMPQARENKSFCDNACRGKYHRTKLAEEEREMQIRRELLESMQPSIATIETEVQEQDETNAAETARLEAIMLEIAQQEQVIEAGQRAISAIEERKKTELSELTDAIARLETEIERLEGLREISEADFYNAFLNEGLAKLKARVKAGNLPMDYLDMVYPHEYKRVFVSAIPDYGPIRQKTNEGYANLAQLVKARKAERDALRVKLVNSSRPSLLPDSEITRCKVQISTAKRKIEQLEQKRLEPPTPPPTIIDGRKSGDGPQPSDGKADSTTPTPTLGRLHETHQSVVFAESKKPKLPKGEIGGADLLSEKSETFMLEGALGAFIGRMDRKMAAFGLTGDSGSGKSTFSLTLAGLFARQGFTVKYFSLEEGLGDSMKRKIRAAGLGNDVRFAEGASLHTIRQDAKRFDVIFIDSFTILDAGQDELEKLRKDFPETIFVCIHQKTTGGTIRGGTKIFYNSTAIINIEIDHDRGRLAVMKKSRYGTEGFMYNINDGEVFRAGDW